MVKKRDDLEARIAAHVFDGVGGLQIAAEELLQALKRAGVDTMPGDEFADIRAECKSLEKALQGFKKWLK